MSIARLELLLDVEAFGRRLDILEIDPAKRSAERWATTSNDALDFVRLDLDIEHVYPGEFL